MLLAEGKNYNEVAKEVGVNRSTIYRWKTENALFMVEHNRLRDNLWVASEARLLKARTAAIEEAMALDRLLKRFRFTGKEPLREEVFGALKSRPKVLDRKRIYERIVERLKELVYTFDEGMGDL